MNSDGNGDIGINIALQHPYSHGRVAIKTPDPTDYPSIDPNYMAHPTDTKILRDGSKLVRAIGKTGPLKDVLTKETSPGSEVQSDNDDDAWDEWLRNTVSTEFHPSSTCAMLPRELGGVVDANLRVYGLSNVRVADASVPPIALSTHLMASTYGVAEQASSIIRAYHDRKPSKGPSFSSNNSSSPSFSPSNSSDSSGPSSSSGSSVSGSKSSSSSSSAGPSSTSEKTSDATRLFGGSWEGLLSFLVVCLLFVLLG